MNEQPKSARVVPRQEQFPGQATDTIRFGDLDPQGHVNQAIFLTYFESGRVAMFRATPRRWPLSAPGERAIPTTI